MDHPQSRAPLAALIPLALGAALAGSCEHASGNAAAPGAAQAAAIAPAEAAASFATVKAVLQHPRCVNCHPAGDAPLQGDDSHLHTQNILRGPEGRGPAGLSCSACHAKKNPPDSYGLHLPPGVSSEWRLPPPDTKMVFAGMGAKDLCEQLKDPKRNGGKDLAALVEHVSTDPLVLWGWAPGKGRPPVSIAHAEFVKAFKIWVASGASCTGLGQVASAP